MAKVLVVDDSRIITTVLAKTLRENGHECLECNDGKLALETARQFRPNLIFMDVVMGDTNGFQTCRQIKRDPQTTKIPVVMLTGKTSETDEFWGRKNGASDYLHKPVDPAVLLKTVEKFCSASGAAVAS